MSSDPAAEAASPKRVPRLREVAERARCAGNLRPLSKKSDNGDGETGKDDLAPSPKLRLSPEERREHYKRVIDGLSVEELEQFGADIQGSSLGHVFHGSADPEVDVIGLPASAPALWSERRTGRKVSPADFVREYYDEWLGKGLTRAHVKKLDLPLYNALAKWITRHPEDDFDPGARRKRMRYTDPEEAVDRIRGQKREWAARNR